MKTILRPLSKQSVIYGTKHQKAPSLKPASSSKRDNPGRTGIGLPVERKNYMSITTVFAISSTQPPNSDRWAWPKEASLTLSNPVPPDSIGISRQVLCICLSKV
jgi:hypothetical protein